MPFHLISPITSNPVMTQCFCVLISHLLPQKCPCTCCDSRPSLMSKSNTVFLLLTPSTYMQGRFEINQINVKLYREAVPHMEGQARRGEGVYVVVRWGKPSVCVCAEECMQGQTGINPGWPTPKQLGQYSVELERRDGKRW